MSDLHPVNRKVNLIHSRLHGKHVIREDLIATASFLLKMESISCSVFLRCPEQISQSCHLSSIHLLLSNRNADVRNASLN